MGSSTNNAASDSNVANEPVKRICVVGVGPVGLGALKVITSAPEFRRGSWEVVAFEARDKIGGIWYPAPPDEDPPLTALYDALTTNTPHPLMCYSSFLYPPGTPLYTPASTVLKYINDFAAHFNLMSHVRLSTPVRAIHWNSLSSKWHVTVQGANGEETTPFDLVLIANGHFRVPRFPQTPGLAEWISRGKVVHTAFYRRPEDFSGKKILVVGGAYSGQDVASESRAFATQVIHSITDAPAEDRDGGKFKVRGRVSEYLDPTQGKVVFTDGSTESEIDQVVAATGYQFNFPFLSEPEVLPTWPATVPPVPPVLHNTTYHIFPLAKHMFPLVTAYPPSSMAFLGLPLRVAPFPLAEIQTQVALKVFMDPSSLNLAAEAKAARVRYNAFREEYLSRGAETESEVATRVADAWFRFSFKEMFDYRDELHEFLGDAYRISQSERELFAEKDLLREQWREIERRREAQNWLHGIGGGENPVKEWEDFMWKVLHRTG